MEKRKIIKHLRSSQLDNNNQPLLPTQEQLDNGEIAINYASGNEKLIIKNSSNEVVTFSTEASTNKKINIIATAINKISVNCGLDDSLNYTPDSTNTLIKDTTNITEAVNAVANRINEIDEVTSKAFNTMNNSCGFNEEMTYIPQNELIQGTTSLAEAIEIVAEKANTVVDTSTLATKEELTDGLANKQDKGDYLLQSEYFPIKYIEGYSDNDGYITNEIAPTNALIISRMYLHPTLNMWCHCPSYETANKGDKIITGGIKYGVSVVVGGSTCQTFPNCKYRTYYIEINNI